MKRLLVLLCILPLFSFGQAYPLGVDTITDADTVYFTTPFINTGDISTVQLEIESLSGSLSLDCDIMGTLSGNVYQEYSGLNYTSNPGDTIEVFQMETASSVYTHYTKLRCRCVGSGTQSTRLEAFYKVIK